VTGVVVAPARLDDGARIWPLARDFATSFRPERGAFDRTFAALVARDDTLLAVATRQDDPADVVGYLLASTHLTFLANGPVCWVEEVMVAPDHRAQGVGAALMEYVEDWASGQGCAYVSLASRRAGGFYHRLGYEDSAVFFKRPPTPRH
jgi:GNAT superfamily N-acetyltransferase